MRGSSVGLVELLVETAGPGVRLRVVCVRGRRFPTMIRLWLLIGCRSHGGY